MEESVKEKKLPPKTEGQVLILTETVLATVPRLYVHLTTRKFGGKEQRLQCSSSMLEPSDLQLSSWLLVQMQGEFQVHVSRNIWSQN